MTASLEWPHLEVFVAVYEEGGMSRAAERLNMSPAYVTKIIKEMEAFLATELFSRESNGAKPTDHGRRVYAESAHLVDDFKRVRMQLQAVHSEFRGDVTIGVLPGLPGTLLARAVDHAIQESVQLYPEIRIKVVESRGAELIELLHRKTLDLAFVQISPTETTLTARAILTEHLVLVADKQRLKDVKSIKSLAALSKYPLIFQTTRGSMRTLIEQACANDGSTLTPSFEIDSIGIQLQLCATGRGACILPASACIGNPFLEHLAYAPILIPGIGRTLSMVQNSNYLSPQGMVVSDLLVRQIENQVKQLSTSKLIQLSS